MSTLERALQIAAEAHAGQIDKAGAPYVLHPLRMLIHMETPEECMAAVLHDVVEDSEWTLDGLRSEGFDQTVVDAVDALTRREGETYDGFIERAGTNPVARRVKLADLEDNLDLSRLAKLGSGDLERLERYHRARQHLLAVEATAAASPDVTS